MICDVGDCPAVSAITVWNINRDNDLEFCGHHYRQHEIKLTIEGWTEIDEAERFAKTGQLSD